MKSTLVKTGSLLFLAGMLVLHAIFVWNVRDLIAKGYSDFTIFYSAGKIMRDGPRMELYDGALQFRVQREFAPDVKIRQAALPYNHPPFEALVFVPLTRVRYLNAYLIWNGFNLLVLCIIPILLRPYVALIQTRPNWFWCLCGLAFFPIFMALVQGQDSIVLLLVFVMVFVSLKKNTDFAAGCWLGLGLFRFHMTLPLVLLLLLRKKWNAMMGFTLVALLLLSVSVTLVGWQTVMHYPEYVMRLEAGGAGGAIVPANMPTTHGLIDPLVNPYFGITVSATMAGLISIVLLLAAGIQWRNKQEQTALDLQFSLALVVAVLVSYHAYAHDLSLTGLSLLLAANHLRTYLPSRRRLAMVVPMYLLCVSPLYFVLWFRYSHLNLLALALLWWTWGLWRELSGFSRAGSTAPEFSGAA